MNPINPLTQQLLRDDELKGVVELANKQIALEAEIATIEAMLEQKQADLKQLRDNQLPDRMKELGLHLFQMSNGASINIEDVYNCYLSDEYPDLKIAGLKWLRTNNAGSLIKHEVKVQLGTDAVKELSSLRGFLNRKGFKFADGQSVHWATLRSFMKERIEAGLPFPMDTFRAFHGSRAKITVSK